MELYGIYMQLFCETIETDFMFEETVGLLKKISILKDMIKF